MASFTLARIGEIRHQIAMNLLRDARISKFFKIRSGFIAIYIGFRKDLIAIPIGFYSQE